MSCGSRRSSCFNLLIVGEGNLVKQSACIISERSGSSNPPSYIRTMAEKIFHFDHEPTFAELWDMCVYYFLYDADAYKNEIEKLFKDLKISKQAKIVDIAAGGGFPALELVKDGYNIACVDGSDDEVQLFNQKAEKQGLYVKNNKVFWNDLPKFFPADSFDFLFCRGNSFIYAGGGWNETIEIKIPEAVEKYKDTLKIFYDLLKPCGYLYIDKFKDSETTYREKVCEIIVRNEKPEDLIFWTERLPEQKIRKASMIRKQGDIEKAIPNVAYDLSDSELEQMMQEVSFRNIKKISLPSEKIFDIWLAQK